MPHNVQQEDIDILLQRSKELYCKVQLLDRNHSVLEDINGVVISGNISMEATAATRRSLSLSLMVANPSFYVGVDKKIWMDKYIRVYLGIMGLRNQAVTYYPMGIYTLAENSYTFDMTTMSLSISCLDLMSELDGTRNGVLGTAVTKIPADVNIRNAMVSAVSQLGNVKNYIISDVGKVTPYDLDFTLGTTVYSIIEKLRDLYPAWETFFNVDGTFICQEIPTGNESNITLDNETIQKLLISSSVDISFSEVKNASEVFGANTSFDFFSPVCTNTDAQYNLTIDNFSLKKNSKIGFTPNANSIDGAAVKINSLAAILICNDNNGEPIISGALEAGQTYALKYDGAKLVLLGFSQISAIAYDNNPDSPFYVGANKENVILQVFSDGEYAQIWTNDLAMQRAKYETWLSARHNDKISISMMLVPWLEVNQKIEFKPDNAEESYQYIVKSISFDLFSGTMSLSAIRFYPLYPFIV